MAASIKWRDKEVENPALRALITVVAIFAAAVGLIGAFVVLMVVVPISLPIHALLRACGRRGFASRNDEGGITYSVGFDGFSKPA